MCRREKRLGPRNAIIRYSNDLNLAPGAALAVDHLASLFGAHAGAEPDLASSLSLADSMGVMHFFPYKGVSNPGCGSSLRQNSTVYFDDAVGASIVIVTVS
jgi:hypothetical protein